MPLSYLPPEILTLIATEIENKKDLKSFSLVCSRFRTVAKKLLVSSLLVFKIGHTSNINIIEFARTEGVGAWVRKLRIGDGFSAETGIEASIVLQQLSEFAQCFPNLQLLNIRNTITLGFQQNQVIECTFVHLTSLIY